MEILQCIYIRNPLYLIFIERFDNTLLVCVINSFDADVQTKSNLFVFLLSYHVLLTID